MTPSLWLLLAFFGGSYGVACWARGVVRWPHQCDRLYLQAPDRAMIALAIGTFILFTLNYLAPTAPPPDQNDAGRIRSIIEAGVISLLMAGMLLAFMATVGQSPPGRLGLHGRRVRLSLVAGLIGWGLWAPITLMVSVLARWLLGGHAPHPAAQLLEQLAAGQHGLQGWLAFFFTTILAAPVAEEVLFRGVLQGWLTQKLGSWPAVVLSAIVFGSVHAGSWPDPIPITILGIGLAMSYRRTRSLLAPITMHAVFNASNLLIVLLADPAG